MHNMKKFAGIFAAITLAASSMGVMPVLADSQKVVTLGADLSDEQKAVMLKYFGVTANQVQVLEVTNQDERDTLGSYIPLEQIGTHTLSCAFVQPTTSGGIQVKTANLNFVTSNMIAAALSTSGVKNCNVIAACPIEVSGTGALTGVTKAFEAATKTTLDEGKKQTAAQEIVTTGQVAETVGQAQATEIVNDIKIQIIEQQVQGTDYDRISDIVDDAVAEAENQRIDSEEPIVIQLSEADRQALENLASQIAQQNYDYEDVRETLDRVEQNTSGGTNVNVNVNVENNNQDTNNNDVDNSTDVDTSNDVVNDNDNSTDVEQATETDASAALDEDSILLNTDDSALGEDVIQDATTPEALPDEPVTPAEPEEETGTDLFEITTTEEGSFGEDGTTDVAPTDEGTADDFATVDDGLTDVAPTDEGTADDFATVDDGLTDVAPTDEGTADDFATVDEGTFTESTPVVDETPVESEPQQSFALPVAFASDFNGVILNSFGLKMYVEGGYVPASGNIDFVDASGAIVYTADLSDTANWGAYGIADLELLNNLGWENATEITILTGNAFLSDGTYNVSGDIVFAMDDGNGRPTAGTETPAVHVEENGITYTSAPLTLTADAYEGFVAGTTATLSLAMPDGAATAEVYSTHEEVASIPEGGLSLLDESGVEMMDAATTLTVYLNGAGATELAATFYDAAGNIINEGVLDIAVF